MRLRRISFTQQLKKVTKVYRITESDFLIPTSERLYPPHA